MKRFLVALFLILIAGLVYWQIHENSVLSAKLTIQMAPASGSKININGKDRKAGVIKVKPGNYQVVISHPGFATSTRSVLVVKGDNKYIGVALVSNSSSTANWYKNNPGDERLAEAISSKNFAVLQSEQEKSLPLIKDLPLIDQQYRVDYGKSLKHPTDPAAVAIYVTYYSNDGKQQALDWLKFKGYTPSNTEVILKNAIPTVD